MDKDKLIARQSELIKTIEAIDSVLHNRDWQVIREVFEKRGESLERQIISHAISKPVDTDEIYILQGRLAEIKRYDLAPYAESLKKELQGIKNNLQ